MEKFKPENKIQKKEGIICRDFKYPDRKWELLPLIMPDSVGGQIEIAYAEEGLQYPKEFFIDLAMIHDEVRGELNKGGILPLESSARLKNQKRLLSKVGESIKGGSPQRTPILDIYGVTFIFPTKSIVKRAQQIIENTYHVPEKFPFGLPTIRTEPNDASSPGYSGIRMNVVFKPSKIKNNLIEGFPQRFLSIAEIKLLSEIEKEKEEKDRTAYEKKRGKDKI